MVSPASLCEPPRILYTLQHASDQSPHWSALPTDLHDRDGRAGPVTEPFLTFSDLKARSPGDGPALRQESGLVPPSRVSALTRIRELGIGHEGAPTRRDVDRTLKAW